MLKKRGREKRRGRGEWKSSGMKTEKGSKIRKGTVTREEGIVWRRTGEREVRRQQSAEEGQWRRLGRG